jgi:hypothetical protein
MIESGVPGTVSAKGFLAKSTTELTNTPAVAESL